MNRIDARNTIENYLMAGLFPGYWSGGNSVPSFGFLSSVGNITLFEGEQANVAKDIATLLVQSGSLERAFYSCDDVGVVVYGLPGELTTKNGKYVSGKENRDERRNFIENYHKMNR